MSWYNLPEILCSPKRSNNHYYLTKHMFIVWLLHYGFLKLFVWGFHNSYEYYCVECYFVWSFPVVLWAVYTSLVVYKKCCPIFNDARTVECTDVGITFNLIISRQLRQHKQEFLFTMRHRFIWIKWLCSESQVSGATKWPIVSQRGRSFQTLFSDPKTEVVLCRLLLTRYVYPFLEVYS
jgi:hypothetical protein